MINKTSGTVKDMEIILISGERLSYKEISGPWFFEFKKGFIEICSNNENNVESTKRHLVPLVQIREVITVDFKDGQLT